MATRRRNPISQAGKAEARTHASAGKSEAHETRGENVTKAPAHAYLRSSTQEDPAQVPAECDRRRLIDFDSQHLTLPSKARNILLELGETWLNFAHLLSARNMGRLHLLSHLTVPLHIPLPRVAHVGVRCTLRLLLLWRQFCARRRVLRPDQLLFAA